IARLACEVLPQDRRERLGHVLVHRDAELDAPEHLREITDLRLDERLRPERHAKGGRDIGIAIENVNLAGRPRVATHFEGLLWLTECGLQGRVDWIAELRPG